MPHSKPRLNPLLATLGMIALIVVVGANWLDPETGRWSVLCAISEAGLGLLLYVVGRILGHEIRPVITDGFGSPIEAPANGVLGNMAMTILKYAWNWL